MLQQTQVATVKPYYIAWMEKYVRGLYLSLTCKLRTQPSFFLLANPFKNKVPNYQGFGKEFLPTTSETRNQKTEWNHP